MPSHEVSFSFLFAVRARVSWRATSQCHFQGQGSQEALGTSLGMGTGKGHTETWAHEWPWCRGTVAKQDRAVGSWRQVLLWHGKGGQGQQYLAVGLDTLTIGSFIYSKYSVGEIAACACQKREKQRSVSRSELKPSVGLLTRELIQLSTSEGFMKK